jgi:Family of unknown function (DUF6444)
MDRLPDLSSLSHAEKDALIHALWAQARALTARVAELEAKLGLPPKTPNNSSLPPSQGKKPNRGDKPARCGPRQGSLGRRGGGRLLAEAPDETVTARPSRCAHCQAALAEETVRNFVWSGVDQVMAKRSSKRMANCALAALHSLCGIFQSLDARFNTRKRYLLNPER